MGDGRFDLLTFGEIMLRLSPPNYELMTRGDVFDKRAGGSELNVASGVALLGLRTGVISRLPANSLGTFIKNRIRFEGVSDDFLIYDESEDARLGIYYYENGAAPRKPSIVYDRKNSSMTRISDRWLNSHRRFFWARTSPCSKSFPVWLPSLAMR